MSDSRYYERTILKETIPSVHLQQSRDIRIYLPPGYNELLSYPVLYCQDGEQFFNFGRIATHVTRMILDEGFEPILIVGVDVQIKTRTSEYSPEGHRFSAYCRFFTEELLPFIEERFPAKPHASERVVAGDSLGGTVSLHLALDYPHLFHRVIALSGAFFPSSWARIATETDLSWLQLYMIVGLQEEAVTTDRGTYNFLDMNRRAQQLLAERNTALHYEEQPGKHIWGFWQNVLPHALHYFYRR